MDGDDPAMALDLDCPACHYNLRGSPDGTCPECGAGFTRKELLALRRKPKSRGQIVRVGLVWLVVYWVSIGPLLIIGGVLLGLFLEKYLQQALTGYVLGAVLGLSVTLWFTHAVAYEMALQSAVYRRSKYPHRPAPSVTAMTGLFLLIEMLLLLAPPAALLAMAFAL